MLIVAGKGYLDPEHREAFLAEVEASLRRTRAEPGCLDYAISADPVEPGRINVYERWESQEHLVAHLATVAQAPQPSPAVRDVEVMRYEISASGPLRL
ncbi:putative quinol monooxygenase [Streptomyces marincola]|uniref:ABM domain-containing protein n=1 Tax=Streptomyces marincola TaxID=2878388 RepID=A0A1W7CX21_9ACTN|nr:putative quinol monooxygenase [Streptomyces marincola]ARQ69285.1 hypothetical protein CAG99_10770 [Streptomyces marincola]